MPAMARRLESASVVFLFCAASAFAQTNDDPFRYWQWGEELVAPRSTGLAEAFVPLANDASAALVNPAGLVLLPSLGELHVAPLRWTHGDLPAGGSYWSGVAFLALTFHKSRADAFGFHLSSPRARFGPAEARLLTNFVGTGASWGRRLRRVSLGVTASLERLHVDAVSTQQRDDGQQIVELRDRGRARLTTTAGIIWQPPGEVLQLGASFRYRHGPWRFQRTAYDPKTLELVETPTTERLYVPSVASAGLAWQRVTARDSFRGLSKVVAVLQGDFLFSPGAGSNLGTRFGFPSEDYAQSKGWGLRLGLETTWPVAKRTCSLQVRVGADLSKRVAVQYEGDDATERGRFPGSVPQGGFGAGISFGGNTGARGHLAVRKTPEDLAVLVAIAVRYPGLFP